MSNTTIGLIRQLLETAENSVRAAQKLLAEMSGIPQTASPKPKETLRASGAVEGKVIEGVFDGQNMIAPDGKVYSVPANYASKSKLVEGDTLKLTITDDGTFIYKQIGPVDRQRVIGNLIRDAVTDEFIVEAQGKRYKVLRASITYFKGEPGDEVVILLPKLSESRWAAIENIIKAGTPADAVAVQEKAELPAPESDGDLLDPI